LIYLFVSFCYESSFHNIIFNININETINTFPNDMAMSISPWFFNACNISKFNPLNGFFGTSLLVFEIMLFLSFDQELLIHLKCLDLFCKFFWNTHVFFCHCVIPIESLYLAFFFSIQLIYQHHICQYVCNLK